MQERTLTLIGQEKCDLLRACKVLVVGVGGVGGYVVEMLTRAGIGNITIIDGDKVDVTNINRQIIALHSTVGLNKVDVMLRRMKDINPDVNVNALCLRVNAENVADIVSADYDYVIDAIDSVNDKLALITEAKRKGCNIISAMGAGNRYKYSEFKIADIFSTKYDKLARKMRGLLKKNNITSLDVCYTESESEKVDGVIGSISYMPSLAGITIAMYVVNKLLEKHNG